MRTSQFLLATVKETPSDAEIISHQLMIRAGMIRKLAAGIYSWLPLGLRVLRKAESVVREEMDRSGAQEVLMPSVQPAELWQESGRWEDYGPELLRFTDRHEREFCYGPTHEEVITTLMRNEIQSYRQLPANFYQIQWKFRDEIRPRFGVMRGREFLMKDAYSFDIDPEGMQKIYQVMHQTYHRIFTRLGLETRAVTADSGTIGGSHSHEFHVLADSGEDPIALCSNCDYTANVEAVPTVGGEGAPPEGENPLTKVHTPGVKTIDDVCGQLKLPAGSAIKTLVVNGIDGPVALLLRGDHDLNTIKAEKMELVSAPLTFADLKTIHSIAGAGAGSVGPLGLSIPIIADHAVLSLADFVCGANEEAFHLTGVNWGRDLPQPKGADLRNVNEGELCPECGEGKLQIRRGIEVGHIFQLGTKYSESMEATCLSDEGKITTLWMGCYGIGVSRIVAAAIEQSHDDNGIIWPAPLAPFDISIVPIGFNKSKKVAEVVNRLEKELTAAGFDLLVDDRNERPGVMFADMDLIGIPHRLVVGERSLERGCVEYQNRRTGESEDITTGELISELMLKVGH
ncbi:MAG: proline--tRNA ligase [Acidiferrobacteraceae bacterium]|nr:proline--tRNA ligase [Acidiferrobacteraceae bacterium]